MVETCEAATLIEKITAPRVVATGSSVRGAWVEVSGWLVICLILAGVGIHIERRASTLEPLLKDLAKQAELKQAG